MKPKRITTLAQLMKARDQRKAVHSPGAHCFADPLPAAFVSNMSGTIIHRLMTVGMFIYEKGKK